MDFEEDLETSFYPCPCGDRFQITLDELLDGEEIGRCPSCSLIIRVIYSIEDFQLESGEEDEEFDFE